MYFAYFDESGDSGVGSGSPTRFFVLACVLVPALSWESTLNRLIDLRRWLRDEYGVPVRPELKALDFVKGRGGFTGSRVDRRERLAVYAQCLRRVATIPDVKVFAIAIEKQGAAEAGWEPRTAAWTFALQRVDRFCRSRDDQASSSPMRDTRSSFARCYGVCAGFSGRPGQLAASGTRASSGSSRTQTSGTHSSHTSYRLPIGRPMLPIARTTSTQEMWFLGTCGMSLGRRISRK